MIIIELDSKNTKIEIYNRGKYLLGWDVMTFNIDTNKIIDNKIIKENNFDLTNLILKCLNTETSTHGNIRRFFHTEIYDNGTIKSLDKFYKKYKTLFEIVLSESIYDVLYKNNIKNIIMPKYNEIMVEFKEEKTSNYLFQLLFPQHEEYNNIKILSNYSPVYISKKTFSNKCRIKDLSIKFLITPETDINEIDLSNVIFNNKSNIVLDRIKNICGEINNFNSLSISFSRNIEKKLLNNIDFINNISLETISDFDDAIKILKNKKIKELTLKSIYVNELENVSKITNLELADCGTLFIENIDIEKLNLKRIDSLKIINSNINNFVVNRITGISLETVKVESINATHIAIFKLKNVFIKNEFNIKYTNNLEFKNCVGGKVNVNNCTILDIEYEGISNKLDTYIKENNQNLLKINASDYLYAINLKFNLLNIYKNKFCLFDILQKIKLNTNRKIKLNIELNLEKNQEQEKIYKIYFYLLENLYYFIKINNKFLNRIYIDDLKKIEEFYNNKKIFYELNKYINKLNNTNFEIDKIKEEVFALIEENMKILLSKKPKLVLNNQYIIPRILEKNFKNINKKQITKILKI